MAIAKNISTDKQLTARMLLTGLFIVVLYSVIIAVLVAVGVSWWGQWPDGDSSKYTTSGFRFFARCPQYGTIHGSSFP